MFEINKERHSLDNDIEDMVIREYKGYLLQTTVESALSESMFDDQLLLASIRRTKQEALNLFTRNFRS